MHNKYYFDILSNSNEKVTVVVEKENSKYVFSMSEYHDSIIYIMTEKEFDEFTFNYGSNNKTNNFNILIDKLYSGYKYVEKCIDNNY